LHAAVRPDQPAAAYDQQGQMLGGYAPLLGLRSLRLIHLDSWLGVPNDISQLNWLETLKISNALCISRPPEALAGLGQLHTRVWLDGDFYKHAADAVLPAGSWLNNLRRLAAPAHLLVNSLPLLEAALRLEHCDIQGAIAVLDGPPSAMGVSAAHFAIGHALAQPAAAVPGSPPVPPERPAASCLVPHGPPGSAPVPLAAHRTRPQLLFNV
jgi:hypothetical protein